MPTQNQTATEFKQDIINDYLLAHPQQQDWTMEDVASWAIHNGRMTLTLHSAIKLCARELADAARVEYHTDEHGRRVRSKYPRRETIMVDGKPRQMVFWEDYQNLLPSHMHVHLQQRRQGIVADCAQLKRDGDSYNDNNPHGAHIQQEFDFTQDLAELEASDQYPSGPDQSDAEDDDQEE